MLGDSRTDWISGPPTRLAVIRCGLGQHTNEGFTLRAKLGENGPVFKVGNTGRIEQAWHQDSLPITFTTDFASPNGTRPENIPSDYYSHGMRVMLERMPGFVTEKMDSHIPKISVFSETSSSNTDVVVKSFWDRGGDEGCVQGLVACVDTYSGQPYPHLSDQLTLWLRLPPYGFDYDDKKWSEWTHIPMLLIEDKNGSRYRSVWFTLMHEFEHTMGLKEHLPNGYILGVQERRGTGFGPTLNDLHGMEETVRHHTHTDR